MKNQLNSQEQRFTYDITLDEARRRAHVVEAIGDNWDPAEALADEERAYDMLYSGLDGNQVRIYRSLMAAGLLPDRSEVELTKPIHP